MRTVIRHYDLDTLESIRSLQDRRKLAGMGASGAAHELHLKRLERLGLVRFVTRSRIEDCERWRCRNGCQEDHPIYEITEAGRDELKEAGR